MPSLIDLHCGHFHRLRDGRLGFELIEVSALKATIIATNRFADWPERPLIKIEDSEIS